MTKVFIGGSRRVSRLNAHFRERLDNIMKKGFPVVIGEANGTDKAVQRYLHDKHYRDVQVFCSSGICRNNVGNWPTRNIPVDAPARTAQFYSAKDSAMAQEATIGLMMWDGTSVGTLLNVFRLVSFKKKAVIYTVPERCFLEFRRHIDWDNFIESRDVGLRRKVEQRARLETKPKNKSFQASFLP